MKIMNEINKLTEVCKNHFDELRSGDEERILVFSFEVESYEIWGGNGDRFTDELYYITSDGWEKHITTKETGLYQKGDGVISNDVSKLNNSAFETLLNSDKIPLNAVKKFFEFYDEIRAKYSKEFGFFC